MMNALTMPTLPAEKSRVPIFDDDRFNREIMVEILDEEGHELITVADGAAALAEMDRGGERFDAVLLDRVMPGIDGMDVLRRIKATPALRWGPVIMQTAAAARNPVVEGVEAGTFYYLTKPFEMEMLRTLVRSAVTASHTHRALRVEVEHSRVLIGLMERASFSIRTPDEARRLAVLLANATPVPDQAALGLCELLLNAIEHGNLGLSYRDKSRLSEADVWEAEVARRLAMPEYAHRRVTLEFRRVGPAVEVLITDQGGGFDWHPYLDLDAARAFHAHGRGIALARKLSFDSVDYLGKGNRVRARFAPRGPAAAAATMAATAWASGRLNRICASAHQRNSAV